MERAKILIAEDEKTQRDLLEGFLKKEGFSVESVANGREALQRLASSFFDIVALDYKMPELDGLHTLREIRKLYPDLPVVMMTAFGTVETAVASMKEGALDYLTKPIDLDEILLIFHKVIERSQLIQENKALKAQLRNAIPSATSFMEVQKWRKSLGWSPGLHPAKRLSSFEEKAEQEKN